jgi:hypothetical protein
MLRPPNNILSFVSKEVGSKLKYTPCNFEIMNSQRQKIMPIIIQIDYYLFEMKVCEASLEKKSTFKDVKRILRQGQIPFSKTITFQKQNYTNP